MRQRRLAAVCFSGLLFLCGALAASDETSNAGDDPGNQASAAGLASSSAPLPELRPVGAGGPYCGIYSLLACLRAVGIDVDVRELIALEYVGAPEGSTASELIAAAGHCGAHARCFTQLTHRELKRATTPMVLHMRSDWTNASRAHWVAFLGFNGDRARILDPPHPVQTFSPAELLATWDGLAIAVSDEPIRDTIIHQARIDFLLAVAFLLAVVFLLRCLSRNETRPGVNTTRSRGVVRLATQLLLLVGGSTILAVVCHAVSGVGFLRNPTALAEVARRYHAVDIPTVTIDSVEEAVEQNNALIIDARRFRDYREGAIPGAVNLPVASSLPERQRTLAGVPTSQRIIVYCQSAGCPYAAEVARFLRFNGYGNLVLYREGYREWSRRHPTQTTKPAQPAQAKDDSTRGEGSTRSGNDVAGREHGPS